MNFSSIIFPFFDLYNIELQTNVAITVLTISFTILILFLKFVLSRVDEIKELYTRVSNTITSLKIKGSNIEDRMNGIERTTIKGLEELHSILTEQRIEILRIIEDYKNNNNETYDPDCEPFKGQSEDIISPSIDYTCSFITENARE